MPWARLSDDWHDHPKVVAAGAEAAGVWAMCLTWARRQQKKSPTPGVVPDDMLRRFAGNRATRCAAKLLEVGLFDAHTISGWPIHDFLDPTYSYTYDPEKKAEAGSKGGKARAAKQAASKLLEDSKQDAGGIQPNPKQNGSRPQATRAATRASTSYLPSPEPEPIPPTAGAIGAALVVIGSSTELVPANAVDVGAIVGEWLESCIKRPPNSVISRIGKQIKAMSEDAIDRADIRAGLAAWQAKGADPSSLPSFVNQAMNAGPVKTRHQQANDDMWSRAAVRAAAAEGAHR